MEDGDKDSDKDSDKDDSCNLTQEDKDLSCSASPGKAVMVPDVEGPVEKELRDVHFEDVDGDVFQGNQLEQAEPRPTANTEVLEVQLKVSPSFTYFARPRSHTLRYPHTSNSHGMK